MLFNKRECCGMMGACPCGQQEPMMGTNFAQQPAMMGAGYAQQPMMMPQDGRDGFECGCGMEPIVEAPIEKCVRRDICHEVQHVCPIHTKIINNHIYRHTYVPQYSCSEENLVSNIDQGSCCNFQ